MNEHLLSKKVLCAGLLLLAVVIGLLQILPGFFLRESIEQSGRAYLPLQMTHHGDSTIFYLPRAQEVADGHFPPSDPHIEENKSSAFVYPPLPQLVFGSLIALVGDTTDAYMVLSFIFTALLFLSFYWMGYIFLNNRLGAVFIGVLGTLTPIAIHLPKAFFSPQLFADIILKNFIPIVRTKLHDLFLARIDDPLLTLSLFTVTFTLLYLFWRKPTVAKAIGLGLCEGLLFYTYLYYWLFIAMMMASLLAYDIFFERRKNFICWVALFLTCALAAVPYILNSLEFRALPQAADVVARVGLESGRGFRFSVWPDYLAYIGLGALTVLLLKGERLTKSFFLIALWAMLLGWNLQIFIGFNVQPDHWPKAFGLPIFILSALLLANVLSRFSEQIKKLPRHTTVVVVMVLISLLIGKKAVNAFSFIQPDEVFETAYTFPADIMQSWRWLNEHTPKEAVILSNSFITSTYLSGYTATNPYLPQSQNTLASNYEIEQRFLTVNKIFGTSYAQMEMLLSPKGNLVCKETCAPHTTLNLVKTPFYLYSQVYNPQAKFDALVTKHNYALPAEKIKELLERYQGIKLDWSNFTGNYLYYGPWEREIAGENFQPRSNFELVYKEGEVEIYKLK